MYFQVYLDRAGQWRWRLRAANHEPVADSAEGYVRYNDCAHAIQLVMQTGLFTPIVRA